MDTKASTLDPAPLELVVSMNLFGTVYSCTAVAPIMKQRRSRKIITVSSAAGTAPSADGGYAHYGAAKAAIAHCAGIWRRISGRSGSPRTAWPPE
jgi:3-oxoacyl-[acyl-carrier protein] reductase